MRLTFLKNEPFSANTDSAIWLQPQETSEIICLKSAKEQLNIAVVTVIILAVIFVLSDYLSFFLSFFLSFSFLSFFVDILSYVPWVVISWVGSLST